MKYLVITSHKKDLEEYIEDHEIDPTKVIHCKTYYDAVKEKEKLRKRGEKAKMMEMKSKYRKNCYNI